MSKIIKLVIEVIVFFLIIIITIFSIDSNDSSINVNKLSIPEHITMWRPVISKYCEINECSEYVELLLAIMYQECGYSGTLDIMQSSESLGLPPNTINDPVESIDAGVKHFKKVLDYGNSKGVDFNTIVQSYNFGQGYIDYIASNGKVHTLELATEFSNEQAKIYGWDSYGDKYYVEHVMRYVNTN